jgi:hypothetical protein
MYFEYQQEYQKSTHFVNIGFYFEKQNKKTLPAARKKVIINTKEVMK